MTPDRFPLCQLPTPLHPLPRLSAELGIDLWIKRDDLTGFGGGGNKGRKLEFLMPQVVASGAEVVVTCGATSSNFVRQLGAACATLGLGCEAVVMDAPFEPGFPRASAPPLAEGGNEVLNDLFGVVRHRMPDGSWDELFDGAARRAAELRAAGRRVFEVKIGGSSAEGAYAFALAANEIPEGFDWVVVASSSGSTLAGLAPTLQSRGMRVVGISADPEEENRDDVFRLAGEAASRFGLPALGSLDLRFDYVGEGYGVASAAGEAATLRMARREGIVLDPVYSAKAFAGLLDLVDRRELTGRGVFWHTGGFPAVFGRPRS